MATSDFTYLADRMREWGTEHATCLIRINVDHFVAWKTALRDAHWLVENVPLVVLKSPLVTI